MPETFDQPPNNGGIYLRRKDGKFERIAAPTTPAPVGITHAARRQGAPVPLHEHQPYAPPAPELTWPASPAPQFEPSEG